MASPELKDCPLVLFCSPRGGSSLVASIFVNHGFWTGETFGGPDGRGSGGYVNYENASIKRYMKEAFPLDAGNHKGDLSNAHLLKKHCHKIVPDDQPWLFKGPSEYYFPFDAAFPKMVPVMVFRDPNQAVEAHVRRYGERVRDDAARIVTQRYRFMNGVLMNRRDAYRVDADRIVAGDVSQIEPILAEYGIALDYHRAMKSISPDLFTPA
jgi:hypothetical protein